MRDKDPERGINSGAERRSVGKERLKKCEGEQQGERARDININNPLFSERERDGEGRLNREMNIKQTEMEGGAEAQRRIQNADGGVESRRGGGGWREREGGDGRARRASLINTTMRTTPVTLRRTQGHRD